MNEFIIYLAIGCIPLNNRRPSPQATTNSVALLKALSPPFADRQVSP